MKWIICSDIHSNLEALKAMLELCSPYAASSRLFCLGDIIGYGPKPDQCLKLALDKGMTMIAGNHERMINHKELRDLANPLARKAIEWTEKELGSSCIQIISELKTSLVLDGGIALVHGSPADPDEYVLKSYQAVRLMPKLKEMGIKICFHGHTHIPGLFDEYGNHFYAVDQPVRLSPEGLYLINPGSVGQPRDRDKRGSFCEFDTETLTVIFRRFEYNIARVSTDIEDSGLPKELGDRLQYGL